VAAVATLLLASHALRPARADEPVATVRYPDTEIVYQGRTSFIVRGAVEISGPAHRWYEVHFQVCLQDRKPLTLPDGKALTKFWGSLFTPENANPARWTGCRLGFTHKDLEAATNLPRGQRSVLWVVCHVYDQQATKWLEAGWDAATALIVTTNDAGNILRTETFPTPPPDFVAGNPAGETIKVKRLKLDLQHLRLRPGAGLFRAIGAMGGTVHDFFLVDGQGSYLAGTKRGFPFEKIDTPEKARELMELAHPGAVVIKTAAQYQAIVAVLKTVKGWDPKRWLEVAEPPTYGLEVTAEPGLGYRVRVMMIDCFRYAEFKLRSIVYRDYAVSHDGRIGVRATVCLRAPEVLPENMLVPAGWQPEFGWEEPKQQPTDPGAQILLGQARRSAAIAAYNKAVSGALQPADTAVIPNRVIVTDEVATVLRPGEVFDLIVNDPKDWPTWASK
jgi:hypothetical protein